MIRKILAAFAVALTWTPDLVQASLMGSQITVTGTFAFTMWPSATTTIEEGVEYQFVGIEQFDFDTDTLTITNPTKNNRAWGHFYYFVFTGFDEEITGLSILSNTGFSGDPLSDYSFTENSITLHWGNGYATPFAALIFQINTAADFAFTTRSIAIPEPAPLLLIGTSLAILAVRIRRRKA